MNTKEELKNIPPDKMERFEETMAAFGQGKTDEEEEDPIWIDSDGNVDEAAYCEMLLSRRPMKCIHNQLYDVDGHITDASMNRAIIDDIKVYVHKGLAKKVTNLLDALKIMCSVNEMPIQDDRIHFQNGTYFIDEDRFIPDKEFCINRLPVAYNPEAPKPVRWLKFLDELLYEEDIPTLQEFMGYTMIPTTRAQKMLMVIGNGGEGKSRIGRGLRAVLGDNMNTTSIEKLAKDRFCPADQEGKLLMLDDDMKMSALPDTNVLKAVVTIEDKIDLERKGKQSFQGRLFVRIMGFGNGSLAALYDRSDGFYRRQIALQVKNKDQDRIDDTKLGDKLIEEAEGIALWMLEGLHRLIRNDYKFTISSRTARNMDDIRKSDNNMMEFYESEGYIRFDKSCHATTKRIYGAYVQWCQENVEKPLAEKTFTQQLRKDAEILGITYDKNLDTGGGKKARGYHGINVMVNTENRFL